MKRLRFIFSTVLTGLAFTLAFPVTYYVSNAGSNTDGLTEATAFLTISQAVNAIAPMTEGTIILVDDNGVVFAGGGNTDVPIGGRRIHLRSKSLNPAMCTIDGTESGVPFFRGLQFTALDDNGSTITGITFKNLKDTLLGGGGALVVGLSSSQQVNITITNCVFE